MRIWHLLILLILPCLLLGQAHVVVAPSSLTPLSAGTISTAESALASAAQNSDFEVRMAFMTSANGTGDRYEEYKGFLDADYMGFFDSPYESAFGGDPAGLEAEHQRLLAMGVDTLGGGENAILIVYTTILNLRDDGTDYDQRKTVLYGNSLSTCDQRRFDQIDEFINPPTEFSPVAAVTQNDAFLSWYSGNLAAATSSNYIITGTILFQGNVYCGGEYVWVNDQQENVVSENTASANHPLVEVLVNPESPPLSVVWSEAQEDNATIYDSKNGLEASLAFYPETYGQFNEVKAFYDAAAFTSIYVRPVNFKAKVDRTLIESHQDIPFNLTYFNNEIPFDDRGSIDIHLGGSFTGAPDLLVPESENTLEWFPGEDVCDELVLTNTLRNINVLSSISVPVNIAVRCAVEPIGISANVLYENHMNTGSAPNPPTYRTALASDDTLFIVYDPTNRDEVFSNIHDDGKRKVTYELIWPEGEEPDEDDFWTNAGYGAEPTWNYSGDKPPTSFINHRDEGGWSEITYDDHFPDDDAGLASVLSPWTAERSKYNASVNVFGFEPDKNIAMLSRNEWHLYDFTTDLFSEDNDYIPEEWKKKLKLFSKIEDKLTSKITSLPWPLSSLTSVIQPKIEITLDIAFYNQENISAPSYYNQLDLNVGGVFGYQLGEGPANDPLDDFLNNSDMFGDFSPAPPSNNDDPPQIGGGLDFIPIPGASVALPLGLGAAGLGIYGKMIIAPHATLGMRKNHYDGFSQMELGGSSIGLDGLLSAGVALFLDENIPLIEVEASLTAGVVFTFEIDFSYNEDTEEYGFTATVPHPRFEINGSVTVNALGFTLISLGGDTPIWYYPEENIYEETIFSW